MGYKTFDKWIDESYDNEYEYETRVELIIKELNKLRNKPLDELYKMRIEMKEVCEHNQMKFKELYDKKYGQDNLNKEIVEIFDKVWGTLNN